MHVKKMWTTIDAHVAGEAFRILVHSPFTLNRGDVLENQLILARKYEKEVRFLLNEPRGHRGMNGCIVKSSEVADFSLLFFCHNEKISFNYSGLIATITALLEVGYLAQNSENNYKVETVYGIYLVRACIKNQSVVNVTVESGVCSLLDEGPQEAFITVDEARHYLLSPLPKDIPTIHLEELTSLQEWGEKRVANMDKRRIDGVILYEPVSSPSMVRSLSFAMDGSIIRSPGVDSTFALFTKIAARNTMNYLTNESIFGSSLTAKVVPDHESRYSIETRGFVTGIHEFIYDHQDPFEEGFLLK